MSEKLTAKQAAEQLLYKPEYAADKSTGVKKEAAAFAEGYKAFLNAAKTEREAAAVSEKMLLEAGYEKFEPKKTYAPGQKIYFVQEHKAVVAATIGQRSFEEGFRLVIAHIDSPRLDLRPNPLYEADHFSYFKTHYYGGIRKYQWGTMPLAIHGVFTRADGSSVSVCVGEDESDPVFCITDLLPHLGAEQGERKLSDGIRAEELNILIGSDAVDDEEVKEAVKLNTMILLNEKYGMTEEDLISAEIEVVPAGPARDMGLDRSMILGYGHDDRVCAYPSMLAQINVANVERTSITLIVDKEEIGSVGATGMTSRFFENTVAEIMTLAGKDSPLALRRALAHSRMLSSDVSAGFDPGYAGKFETKNAAFMGRGLCFNKYTGSRGKGGSNDADAEYVALIRDIMDEAGVDFQTCELGRVNAGGGGTIAYIMAKYGMNVIDSGVAVLSMHALWEVANKADIYEAYRGYKAFLERA